MYAALICGVCTTSLALFAQTSKPGKSLVDIGSRLEPFVDDWLVEHKRGVSLELHHPTPQDVAITFTKPCEGNTCCYVRVFRDGDVCRAYYRGSNFSWETRKTTHAQFVCYAESKDGIRWTKPKLGLYEFKGSKDNNIVWPSSHNFAPFKDTNPSCKPQYRYKALGSGGGGLVAYGSPDGIHWKLIRKSAVITKGAFDSQNLAFWDEFRGRYVDFHRGFQKGVRDIMTCTSEDFIHWTEPKWLDYGDAPNEHLYTNATIAYHRAPHIFMAFPKRFYPTRKKIIDHPYPGVSDGVLMTSRDGLHWHRWMEGFIRPGPMRERWWQRNNMTAWGMLVTKSPGSNTPDELSLYSTENYYVGPCRLRRFTIRMDGFVSVNALYSGGEFTTRPIKFTGKELVINYATSAAGSVRVEIRDKAGKPIPGFTLRDCPEVFGDEIERAVAWKQGSDLSKLAGKPIRVRFVLKDADLYSIRFRP